MTAASLPGDERTDLARALVGGAALLGAMVWPVWQNWRAEPRDGFPLSYYPMFSVKRRRSGTVVHLVGVDAAGATRLLNYRHAGTGGLNQVRRQIARSVRDRRAERLAATVADSVRRSRQDADLVAVRVVSGTYRYSEFFAGRVRAIRETVHATAPVR